jgi:membrane-bound lytic murein transglycosylase F
LLAGLALAGCGMQPTAPPWRQGELVVAVPDNGTVAQAGFERELVDLFRQEMRARTRLLALPPDQMATALQKHKVHFAVGMDRSGVEQLRPGPVYRAARLQVLCGKGYSATNGPRDSDWPLVVVAGSAEEAALRKLQQTRPQLHWEARSKVSLTTLLEELATGKSACSAADGHQLAKFLSLHPGLGSAADLGVSLNQVWALPKDGDAELLSRIDKFFADIRRKGVLRNLQDRHFGDQERGLSSVEATDFIHLVNAELPRYRKLFEEAGRANDIDWRLIAAIAYHESNWNPLATSPTNVRGMMMLTEDTAERMNVRDRLNPNQSVMAGAKYLKLINERLPASIPEPDRTWFALAAYNQGPAHLEDARILAQRRGLNPNLWVDVKAVLPLLAVPEHSARLKFGRARGGEAVIMVENIRQYSEILHHLTPESRTTPPDRWKLPQIFSPGFWSGQP